MKQLLDYNELISKVAKEFDVFKSPERITISGEPSEQIDLIEADFKNLDREKMTRDESVMMVIDGPLISDEAILYFLPVLVKFYFKRWRTSFYAFAETEISGCFKIE